LSNSNQTALNDVTRLMSDHDRKTLGWKTAAKASAKELGNNLNKRRTLNL